jgi:hypothetical protein
MDDYIFLIIAIGLSIFGAINQNKKKKDREKDNPLAEKVSKPRNFFMDQLLGEDFLEKPMEAAKPPVRVRPVMEKTPLTVAMPTSQSVPFHPGFISTLPNRPIKNLQPTLRKPRVETVEEDQETDENPSYLEDFSLRKAFVYSEIMNRKY